MIYKKEDNKLKKLHIRTDYEVQIGPLFICGPIKIYRWILYYKRNQYNVGKGLATTYKKAFEKALKCFNSL